LDKISTTKSLARLSPERYTGRVPGRTQRGPGFVLNKKVLLNGASSCQTRKNRRQACFLTGGQGQKTSQEPILTKYGAARRILITLSQGFPHIDLRPLFFLRVKRKEHYRAPRNFRKDPV
jgi:hypothetical protein